jgi:hypothetical protein
MKKHFTLANILFITAMCSPLSASAENIDEIFTKVKQYSENQNYPKAIEELAWAEKELQKLHFNKLQSFFPETLGAFKGKPAESQAAFGMSSVEKEYRDGKGILKISLAGGSGGAANNPMGGIAALARMGQMMGQQPGVETFRIDGRTANLKVNEKYKNAELTVFLEGGSILTAKLTKSADGDLLRQAIKQLPLTELDNYLKGAASAK